MDIRLRRVLVGVAAIAILGGLPVLADVASPGATAEASGGTTSYAQTVKDRDPWEYWRLGANTSENEVVLDAGPPVVKKVSMGSYPSGISWGSDGALLGDSDTAMSIAGGGGVSADAQSSYYVPGDRLGRVTVEAWVKITDPSPEAGLLFNANKNNGGFRVQVSLDDELVPTLEAEMRQGMPPMGAFNPTTVTAPGLNPLTPDEWHHIVAVAGDGRVELWVDGVIDGQGDVDGRPFVQGDSFLSTALFGQVGDVDVDEVAVYTEALSPGAIQENYKASGRQPRFSPSEMFGPNGAMRNQLLCQRCHGDPVDAQSGNLFMPVAPMSVPGRGPGLNVGLGYNSLAAASDSKTGFGWASTLDMRIETLPGGEAKTVVQETGATVPFTWDGSTWVPPGRFEATLEADDMGTPSTNDDEWEFTRQHFEHFRFDSRGRLAAISDQFGNTTTLVYPDATSTEAEYMEDEASRRFTFSWSGGRLDTVTDPLPVGEGGPRVADLGYDASGNLTSYVDFSGGTTTFTYDTDHRMLTMRKPRHQPSGPVVENNYDSLGRVDWQEDELDRRTTFEYDKPGFGQTRVTDPEGKKTVHTYVDNRAEVTTVGYGTADAVTTKMRFDPDTYALEEIEDGAGKVTKFESVDGNVTMIEDPTGRISRFTYNAFDQVELAKTGEIRTGPSTTSTAAEVVTKNEYDAGNGRLEKTTVAYGTAEAAVTDLVYGDSAHPEDVTTTVDARGKSWHRTYASGTGYVETSKDPTLKTSATTYNTIGWPLTTTSPRGVATTSIAGDYQTSYSYDIANRTTTVTSPTGDVSRTVLDANGNTISTATGITSTNPTGDVTTYTYTAADELWKVDAPGAGYREYTYRDDGLQSVYTNELGDDYSYDYDDLGRLTSEKDPLDRVTSYGYDAASRLSTVTQPVSGATCTGTKVGCITYHYDDASRPTGIDYSDPATADAKGTGSDPYATGIVYDELGRRTSQRMESTARTWTETWSWNKRSQLTSHIDANGRTTGYGWDGTGNLTSITYPGQTSPLLRGFDDAGRLKTVTDWASRVSSFDYDDDSNWTTTTFPGSVNTDDRVYDASGRMTSVTWNKGTTVLGSETYTRPTSTKGMVDTLTPTGAAGTAGKDHTYDTRDRLTGTGTETFELDAASNLTNGPDGRLQVFDPAQQLCWTSPTATTGTCATPTSDATTYTYDSLGNRRTKTTPEGNVSTYSYDQANRLTTAVVPDTGFANPGEYTALPAAVRVADSTSTTAPGTCGGGNCTRLAAGATTNVKITDVNGVPAAGVTAVSGTIRTINPDDAGSIRVNPNGSAAVAEGFYAKNESIAVNFVAKVSAFGRITITTSAASDFTIDITGYHTAGAFWVGANYEPVAATRIVDTRTATATGVCNGTTCTRLTANQNVTAKVAGQGGVPNDATAAVISVLALGPTGTGSLKVNPNGAAAAGQVSYTSGQTSSAVITAPIDANGNITLNATTATDVVIDIAGWYTNSTETDSGNSITLLSAATRSINTANGTGTCNGTTCTTLPATSTVNLHITGSAGVPTGATAALVNITVVNPSTSNLLGVAVNPSGGAAAGVILYTSGESASLSAVVPLDANGRFPVTTTTSVNVTVDVVGYYNRPLDTWTYTYGAEGLRNAKQEAGQTATQFTWNTATGLPLLLSQHIGTGTSYLIYGPNGTPIYQIRADNTIIYYHQDQLGSTRLVTNSSGNNIGSFTYTAYGQQTSDTMGLNFSERPLLRYQGQYTDNETGLVYLRARYLDPIVGSFTAADPAFGISLEMYGYGGSNPVNSTDPYGLFGIPEWVPVVGGSDCIRHIDDDCERNEKNQEGADFGAGVIDTLSGGNADVVLERTGNRDKANLNSSAATVGRIAGYGVAIAHPAGFVNMTQAGGVVRLTRDAVGCAGDPDSSCLAGLAWSTLALAAPGGAAKLVRPFGPAVAYSVDILGGLGFDLGEACYQLWREKLSDT